MNIVSEIIYNITPEFFKYVFTDINEFDVDTIGKNINLEFNPHFLEEAIKNNLAIVECPINFYPRVGVSKGGNVSNQIAFNLGLRMIKGIIFGWKKN